MIPEIKSQFPLPQNPRPENYPPYAIYNLQSQIGLLAENASPLPTMVEAPFQTGFDYGLNLIRLAGQMGVPANQLTQDLASKTIPPEANFIQNLVAAGPYLNVQVDMPEYGGLVLSQVLELKDAYGKEEGIGDGRRVIIDMSSPNIAKRMSYGHLRSTIIGDALARLHQLLGYDVIRDNHVGDWGTGFGKLIFAIKEWGNEEQIVKSEDPIGSLQELYVQFHSKAEDDKKQRILEAKANVLQSGLGVIPGLQEAVGEIGQSIKTRKNLTEDQLDQEKILEDALERVIDSQYEKAGRAWFLKLEQGDPEAIRLWKLCIDLSMKEFDQIYQVLGVGFEMQLGESFYEPMLAGVVQKVKESGVGTMSNGALVVDMQDQGLGVAMIQKSDGASLYMTRDIAGAAYRQDTLEADQLIYVVGEDQKQYFQQLFEVLKKLGYEIGNNAEHVYFGMVSLPEGKMSTRRGRVILLKDVIDEGMKRAGEVLDQKNPKLASNIPIRDEVVRQIAIGALKWNDLSQDSKRPIVFDWDKALNFEGNSAPYVQYAAVRAQSILTASGYTAENFQEHQIEEQHFQDPAEKALIRQLAEFPQVIKAATASYSPPKIAAYVYELAKRFNSFYAKVPVLKAEDREITISRLKLVEATAQVIKNSLSILGIEVPQEM